MGAAPPHFLYQQHGGPPSWAAPPLSLALPSPHDAAGDAPWSIPPPVPGTTGIFHNNSSSSVTPPAAAFPPVPGGGGGAPWFPAWAASPGGAPAPLHHQPPDHAAPGLRTSPTPPATTAPTTTAPAPTTGTGLRSWARAAPARSRDRPRDPALRRRTWTRSEELALETAMAEFGSSFAMILDVYGRNGLRSSVLADFDYDQLRYKARNLAARRRKLGLDPAPFDAPSRPGAGRGALSKHRKSQVSELHQITEAVCRADAEVEEARRAAEEAMRAAMPPPPPPPLPEVPATVGVTLLSPFTAMLAANDNSPLLSDLDELNSLDGALVGLASADSALDLDLSPAPAAASVDGSAVSFVAAVDDPLAEFTHIDFDDLGLDLSFMPDPASATSAAAVSSPSPLPPPLPVAEPAAPVPAVSPHTFLTVPPSPATDSPALRHSRASTAALLADLDAALSSPALSPPLTVDDPLAFAFAISSSSATTTPDAAAAGAWQMLGLEFEMPPLPAFPFAFPFACDGGVGGGLDDEVLALL
ncbi:hypothetical protein H9P43_004884 [Blastocladiella emersonii ATCC 22665]|nr:hypothetical protein H9P43_004884 [Blastocladiella emersonii ATCC 22665]